MAALARALWRQWAAWLLAGVLLAAAGGGWLAARHAAAVTAPELSVTTREIATSLAAELERALALGIPVNGLVGVDAWAAGVVQANPVVRAIELSDAAGTPLHRHGEPGADDAVVVRLPLRGVHGAAGDPPPVGWLQLHGQMPPAPWQALGVSLLWALVPLAAALAWLRRVLRRQVVQPMARVEATAQALTARQWPGTVTAALSPGAQAVPDARGLLARLTARAQALARRHAALTAKLGEVRAAHFDPRVIARLDELAATLSAWGGTAAPASASLQAAPARREVLALPQRLVAAALAGLLAVALLAAGTAALHQRAAARDALRTGETLLRTAWDATLEGQRITLRDAIQRMLAVPGLLDAMALALRAERDGSPSVAVPVRPPLPDAVVVSVLGPDAELLGTSAPGPARPYPSRAALRVDAVRTDSTADLLAGVWQGQDRRYQSGLARAVADGSGRIVAATVPLAVTVDLLARRLDAPVVLVDLRGQPVGPDALGLAASWREQGRRSHAAELGGVPRHVLAIPLVTATGHTGGTLLAARAVATGYSGTEGLLMLAALAVMLAVAVAVAAHARRSLRPFARQAEQLRRLANDPDLGPPGGAVAALRLAPLRRAVAEVGGRIDALWALRRSRERQGRRQARFIRHQMMALATRLDPAARVGVLADLQRIEDAGRAGSDEPPPGPQARRPGADPWLDPVVDEVGVLALGFQNLVSRVGDQYQQLDRLVAELREALRVKTQYIAIQQELEIARKMQLSILPRDFTDRDGLSLRASMTPAKEVGGDFYDFFPVGEHQIAVAVGDVSGKGVPAAFFMAVSRTLLRAVARFDPGPAACLRRLNELLAADNDEMMFVTLFYAVIDTRDGGVVWGNGGHNPPYLVRAGGGIEALPTLGNMALAVMEGMDYQEGRLTLVPGDGLYLYSDGVTEAMSPVQELFGEPRLEALLQALHGAPVAQVPAAVLQALREFEGEGAQADDITSLMLRWAGPVGGGNE